MPILRETDEFRLRQRLLEIIEQGPLERLQALATFLEVGDDGPQSETDTTPERSEGGDLPVPASLIWPSNEVLAAPT